MDGIKISDLDTISSIAYNNICVGVIDLLTNGTKNITFGNLIKSGVSPDTGNLLGSDTNGLNKITFTDNLKSSDADNLIAKGADNKIRLEAGADLISTDANNAITKSGTDKKLFVDANFADAKRTIKGISYLNNLITIEIGTDADHDIDFSAGKENFDDGTGFALASALTKQLDAEWVAGDNAGGLANGLTIAINTWYYAFVLSNSDGSVVDFGFDTSKTASNLLADPDVISAGLTKYTLKGVFKTDGSANIEPFEMSNLSEIEFEIQHATKTFKTQAVTGTSFVNLANGNGAGFLDVPAIKLKPIFLIEMGSRNGIDPKAEFRNDTISQWVKGHDASGGIDTSSTSMYNRIYCKSDGSIDYRLTATDVVQSLGIYGNGFVINKQKI